MNPTTKCETHHTWRWLGPLATKNPRGEPVSWSQFAIGTMGYTGVFFFNGSRSRFFFHKTDIGS